jgi:hypothetical protein
MTAITQALTTSRRSFLHLAGGVVIAAAVPVSALAGDNPDAALFAFERPLKAIFQRWDVLLKDVSERERRYLAVQPEKPDSYDPRQPHYDDLAYEASLQAHAAWRVECKRLEVEHGIPAAEEAEGKAGDEWSALCSKMLATPAHTIEGMRFKLAVADSMTGQGELLEALSNDLVNIGGPIAFWSDEKTEV